MSDDVETSNKWDKRMKSYSTREFLFDHARQMALHVDGSATAFVLRSTHVRHARPITADLIDELLENPGRWSGALVEPITGDVCTGAAGRVVAEWGDVTAHSQPLSDSGGTAFVVHVNDRRVGNGDEAGAG